MKKSLLVTTVVAGIFFASCSDITTSQAGETSTSVSSLFGSYASVVKSVAEKSDRSIVEDSESEDIDAHYLLEQNYITENASVYIFKIENFLESEENTDVLLQTITEIETEAANALPEAERDLVLYYGESAKWAVTDDAESSRSIRSKLKKIAIKAPPIDPSKDKTRVGQLSLNQSALIFLLQLAYV